jgi:hypothetical protein
VVVSGGGSGLQIGEHLPQIEIRELELWNSVVGCSSQTGDRLDLPTPGGSIDGIRVHAIDGNPRIGVSDTTCEIVEGLRENRDWIGKQERTGTDGWRMSALARFKKSVTIS